ncbi:hypothetical protein Mp_2g19170 [Marchantia polymorpha subsp. ruderalis]|uniref:Secreted protein n=1 Tax=Marchantia polymorpha TaxID=3197 RepID=A0A2R6W8L4_MARPO|nr:hypothetical protein MARPO_0128s0030 [Marchantia polymorpha]BBN02906.1 hypothetical protein Mp_2g19170 [Marchantia polymorpha subsp. ruderalis]|eukprot:PTQ30208.1 hypothetical protein MARPO_0128s0030 [Marchantia polymorpha]
MQNMAQHLVAAFFVPFMLSDGPAFVSHIWHCQTGRASPLSVRNVLVLKSSSSGHRQSLPRPKLSKRGRDFEELGF